MMRKFWLPLFLGLTLLATILAVGALVNQGQAAPIRLDIAPPEPPPGSNISPEGQTQVEMVAEQVSITVQPVTTTIRGFTYEVSALYAKAEVEASFTMRNTGEVEERMEVRFPLANPNGMGDGWFGFPEITDLRAWVNDSPASTRRITTENDRVPEHPIAWASFPVVFPPGKDVSIRVAYSVKAYGYYPVATFIYILETGAGWKGPIQHGEIVVRLPYEASDQNVFQGEWYSSPGSTYSGREVRWQFENLEPAPENNILVDVVVPSLWNGLRSVRQEVKQKPNDLVTWARYARIAQLAALDKNGKGWTRSDPAGQALLREALEAYAQVAPRTPNDLALHADYARALWAWVFEVKYGTTPPPVDDPELGLLVEEFNRVLQADPENELRYSRDNMLYYYEGMFTLQEDGTVRFTPGYTPPPTPASLGVTDTAVPATPTSPPPPTDAPVPPSATPEPPAPTRQDTEEAVPVAQQDPTETAAPGMPATPSPEPEPEATAGPYPLGLGLVLGLLVVAGMAVLSLVLRRRR